MKNFMSKFEAVLKKVSDKFAQSKLLNVIGGSFAMIMPMTIVGSFASLARGVDFGGYQKWLQSTPLYNILGVIFTFTTGVLSLYLVFSVGYTYAQKSKLKKQSIAIGLTSLLAFFIITPYVPASAQSGDMLPLQWTGAQGLFMAVIVGMISGFIFKLCLEHHIEITLPSSVPPTIAKQFSALLPIIFVTIFFSLVSFVFSLTPFGDVQSAFYKLLSIPLGAVQSSVFGLFFLASFMYLLWFFGIHGGMIVGPMFQILFMDLAMANLAAYQAGEALPHLFIGVALSVGSGSFALLLCILFFAKSKQAKSIAKMAVIPSFFGVDEPAYFGLPMIMNPIFFLPWVIINPFITTFGTYFLEVIGVLGYPTGAATGPFIPFLFKNMALYGIGGFIIGFIFLIICTLVYVPFVRVYDKECLEKEAQQEAIAEAQNG
ncbi:MAG: PTS sugar transporter subunit IIC [Longibaculum sp.]